MIPAKVRAAMNEQIKHEMESFYIYHSMVAYFAAQNLDGMAHWMRCQAHEEMVHAMKFFDHILERGEKVELLDLRQLKTEWSSPLEAWQDALEHEKFITGKIHDLTKLARDEDDFQAEPMLAWFNTEQIEEEANADRIASQVEMVGENKQGLLMLDKELAARVFPAGSPLDPAAYTAASA
ncbi:MAG: ferritin [Kiritimatiellae bacterium]|nr:ferritin [Kiritimatiellia bacterium]